MTEPDVREVQFDAVGIRALVVDDNEINRSLLQTLLEHLAINVTTAESGSAAISLAERYEYQVMFVDIHMPGMDGIQVINRIRALLSAQTPVLVAVTADVFGWRSGAFGEAEFDAVLIKPIEEQSLRKILIRFFPTEASDGSEKFSRQGSYDERTVVFDRAKGIEFAAGSDELWRRNLRRLLDMLPGQLDKLHTSLEERNWADFLDVAHYIKGPAQYVAANALCECVERLEDLGRQCSVSNCLKELSVLKEECQRLRSAFDSLSLSN